VIKARLAVALLVVGLVAGCTTSEAGVPVPGDPTTGSSSDSGSTDAPGSSATEIPPPPKDLSLDGLDPCTLFTDAQQAQLGIDDFRTGVSGGTTIYKDMKNCALDKEKAEPFYSFDVVAVTNVDVDYWINQPHNVDVTLISIGGYPAAEFKTKGTEGADCAVALGVAKNQHLHVEFVPLSEDYEQDQLCQRSEQAAEMALQTLQTLR
jgi:hypothetical protein